MENGLHASPKPDKQEVYLTEMVYQEGVSPWNFVLEYKNSKISYINVALRDLFFKEDLKPLLIVQSGDYVCCSQTTNKIFRAIVLGLLPGDRVKVLMVDSNVRKIVKQTEIFELPSNLVDIPAQSIQCCLFDLDNQEEKLWNEDLSDIYKSMLSENRLFVNIVEKVESLPPKFSIKLFAYNTPSEMRLNVNKWICQKVLHELKQISHSGECDDLTTILSEKAIEPFHISVSDSESYIQKIEDEYDLYTETKLPELCEEEKLKLSLERSFPNFVDQIEYVKLNPSQMQQIAKNIKYSKKITFSDIKPGYSEESNRSDMRRSRSKCRRESFTKTDAEDYYGNDKHISPSNDLSRDESKTKLHYLVKESGGKDIFGWIFTPVDWRENVQTWINSIGNERMEDPSDFCSTFFEKGTCLCWKCPQRIKFTNENQPDLREPPEISLPNIGDKIKIYILNVTTGHQFYASLLSEYTALKQMMADINHPINSKIYHKIETVSLGQLLLAKGSDGLFRRAEVIDVDSPNVEVFFVDYGYSESIKNVDLRQINDRFLNLPKQAILSSLPSNIVENETTARMTLIQMIQDKEINAVVLKRQSQDPKLEFDLFQEDGINIADFLMKNDRSNSV